MKIYFGKVLGAGESWFCLYQGNNFVGTAHEDDKIAMDDLRNLMLALKTN